MSSARRANSRPNTLAGAPVKKRQCLMCHDTFPSKWAGERICPRCKGTTTWREGNSADFVSSGGRR